MTKIVWLSKRGARVVNRPVSLGTLLAAVAASSALLLGGGYSLGRSVQTVAVSPQPAEPQPAAPAVAGSDAAVELDAMASRLTVMQAQLLRLEAVGKRVVAAAGLDDTEFDFDQMPPMGGFEETDGSVCVGDFLTELNDIEQQIAVRFHQLNIIDEILRTERVSASLAPSGWPVPGGWISSRYGYRADPMTGQRAFHPGIDIAGKPGSDVAVLAGGLVTWVGNKSGYGNTVEVDHGNGYKTRYAHNQVNLVSVGDLVRRGDVIARLGNTGRSTGPHLHLELLRSGRHLNPSTALSKLNIAEGDG